MNTPETQSGGSLEPVGSETTLDDCPAGLFMYGDTLGFKTEYRDQNGPEAYVVASGEYFWGGTDNLIMRKSKLVTPMAFIPNH